MKTNQKTNSSLSSSLSSSSFLSSLSSSPSISSLSFKALEARARRAAAIAANIPAPENSEKKKNKQRKTSNRPSPIEREIHSIFQSLSANSPDTEVVFLEMTKNSSCLAMIRVFNRDDLAREQQEAQEKRNASRLDRTLRRDDRDSKANAKPFKASPIVSYALYPSSYDAGKLGSVAIYGHDAPARRTQILKQRSLFGYPVVSATLEVGRRPFVDVTLRA